jgi:elongation factor G
MKCFKYTNDLGTEIEEIEIPEDHKERAEIKLERASSALSL